MINPNKNLTQKALAGVQFLRMHAEAIDDDDDFFIAIMREPHVVAADAIEQLVKENEALRAQLIAFQKAANPAVAVDPAAPDGERTCYVLFTEDSYACLKDAPDTCGVVTHLSTDKTHGLIAFFCPDFHMEANRWIKVERLEFIPRPDE